MAGAGTAGRPVTGSVPPGIRCAAFGDRALLVEPDPPHSDPGSATVWVLGTASVARRVWPGATVVPGLRSVLVAFDSPGHRPSPPEVVHQLEGGRRDAGPGAGGEHPGSERLVTIPVRYDGPDLADVAGLLDVSVPELVARHRAATWTVVAIGFSPGFAYLTTPDPLFAAVPRRPEPRRRVPAGSVALAAGMCAVYPSATPGGWQLIGSTEQVLFDAGNEPPATLAAGDRIEFREGA